MDCGVFGSQIVLADGFYRAGEEFGEEKTILYNLELLTYDTVTKHVFHEDIPRCMDVN